MKFGVNVPNYGPDASPEALGKWAAHLEDMGYHHLMVSDHVALTPEVQRLFPAPFYDPFTLLAWFAGTTNRIGLGTTVAILPYRHPLLVAGQAAAIDRLSGGRFTFGAAAGWAAAEFSALGVAHQRRGAISDEYLAAIKACWANDVASFHGRHVSFDQVHTGPRPVQQPGPPVWVGGHSAGALRRAVRYGDAWHPTSVNAAWLTRSGLPALRWTAEELELPVPGFAPRIKLRITGAPLGGERVLGEGTVEQIRADLRLLEELGASSVILDPTYPGQPRTAQRAESDLAALELLATRIIDLEQACLR
jgi:probable F420-dependent oxidoreductase